MKYYNLFFCVFALSFTFIISIVNAQEKINSMEFTPQIAFAKFSADQIKLSGLIYGGEVIYHIDVENHQQEWQKLLGVNRIGLVFNYKYMKNVQRIEEPKSEEFANSYALLAALNITLLKHKNISLNFSPAFGIGYVGQTWFTNENPVISSHVNFTSRANLKVEVNVNSTTKISSGVDVLHYSNAGLRVPNNGVNVSSVSLGLIKTFKPKKYQPDTSFLDEALNKHSFDIGINIGKRGVHHSKEGLFKTGFYAGYNYKLNSVLTLAAGIDAVYYHSVFDPNRFVETFQSNATSYDRWRIGLASGPDLWMGRLAFTVKYGYYLHFNSYKPIHTYWTSGFKYKLNDWLAAQAKVYVNKTDADYVGFGLLFTK